jgi:hypothetical protein
MKNIYSKQLRDKRDILDVKIFNDKEVIIKYKIIVQTAEINAKTDYQEKKKNKKIRHSIGV